MCVCVRACLYMHVCVCVRACMCVCVCVRACVKEGKEAGKRVTPH